jgi:hypothetical protein
MLKPEVYFSDEEQSGSKEVPEPALLRGRGEKDIMMSELEKKAKNFY